MICLFDLEALPDLSLGEADLSFLPLRLLAGVLPDLLLSFLFLCGGGDTLARLFLGGGEAEGLRFLTLRCGDLLRLALDFLCPPRFGEELGVDFLLSGDLRMYEDIITVCIICKYHI